MRRRPGPPLADGGRPRAHRALTGPTGTGGRIERVARIGKQRRVAVAPGRAGVARADQAEDAVAGRGVGAGVVVWRVADASRQAARGVEVPVARRSLSQPEATS